MRKIIIACDSYKGCLTSKEVNEAMALGVKSEERRVKNSNDVLPAPEIITLEMSDGGDGMLDAFLSAMGGERVTIHAHDALMMASSKIRQSSKSHRLLDWLSSNPSSAIR